MCELLVCSVNTEAADFYVRCAAPQRGDVIALHPDGYAWSNGEMNHLDWHILILDRPIEDLQSLLGREILAAGGSPKTLQYRGFYLDIDDPALPIKPRPAINDPAVIGTAPEIIG